LLRNCSEELLEVRKWTGQHFSERFYWHYCNQISWSPLGYHLIWSNELYMDKHFWFFSSLRLQYIQDIVDRRITSQRCSVNNAYLKQKMILQYHLAGNKLPQKRNFFIFKFIYAFKRKWNGAKWLDPYTVFFFCNIDLIYESSRRWFWNSRCWNPWIRCIWYIRLTNQMFT
jgi:hypothetical protein